MKSYTKLAITIVAAVVVAQAAIGIVASRYFTSAAHQQSTQIRKIIDIGGNDEGCMLDCGNHGVCKFDKNKEPYCLCETQWATFPEARCEHDPLPACKLDANNLTVCECNLRDGGVFNNPKACSYERMSFVKAIVPNAIASWTGAGWYVFAAGSRDACAGCTATENELTASWSKYSKKGRIAAGFFALFTVDYLGAGWIYHLVTAGACTLEPISYNGGNADHLGFKHECPQDYGERHAPRWLDEQLAHIEQSMVAQTA